ncbi:hypothetical protein [Sphingomonas crocodyli]|uniref:Uncharacterized protein n=1 Tax=Sphingomonas crocodyli TaxID=1979270 RepID=A0A437LY67_9SPHN|nr:hypothetical protein [Sphingomonas crocodyli]RVT90351.1 hypothetical protein EOD43_18975 [Sphingomonas crocodyli]
MSRPPLVERAFQLANGGGHPDWRTIEHQLIREGYAGVAFELNSPLLRKQLNRRCAAARE